MNNNVVSKFKIVLTPYKHDIEVTIIYLAMAGILYAGGFISYLATQNSFYFSCTALIGTVLLLFVLLFQYPYFHRTIIMDEKGVTVILGKKQKIYLWENINTVFYNSNNVRIRGVNEILTDGYILSTKRINSPKYLYPTTFCLFFHPYTSVFLRFPTNKKTDKFVLSSFTFSYEVDKELIESLFRFINKIKH